MPRASPSSSNSHSQSPRALRIRIRGQVQGVGCRLRLGLAQEFGVQGRVLNDSEGVLVEAWGTALDAFIAAIPARPPALSGWTRSNLAARRSRARGDRNRPVARPRRADPRHPRCRNLPGLRGRDPRGRAAAGLRLHQLHPLRPSVLDPAGTAL